ncbi:MAG: hypothetical protein ABSC42_12330 [Tepidisphaeraceae bacterium]
MKTRIVATAMGCLLMGTWAAWAQGQPGNAPPPGDRPGCGQPGPDNGGGPGPTSRPDGRRPPPPPPPGDDFGPPPPPPPPPGQ